jgi:hypothetical protein
VAALARRRAVLLAAAGWPGSWWTRRVAAPRAAGWPAGRRCPLPGASRWSSTRALAGGTPARPHAERADPRGGQDAGTLLDSAFGVEPSFVTDMVERRYWARRGCGRGGCPARCPYWWPRICCWRRRPRRLLWLAGAAALPALLAHAPGWLLGVAS